MNHRQIETDILHLEQVIGRISTDDRIPLSYWRNRIDLMHAVRLFPRSNRACNESTTGSSGLKPAWD